MAERVQTLSFRRGRLPHWLVADHSYFVTLCRKGCLPAKVVAALRAERAQLAEVGPSGTSGPTADATDEGGGGRASTGATAVARDVPDRVALQPPETPVRAAHPPQGASAAARRCLDAWRERFLRIDATLDAAARSDRDLCAADVSTVILGSLEWLRGRGWRIWAATLMPSHMHLVVRNTEGRNDTLRGDLSRFMVFTAREANAVRGESGPFWQSEPFDHWCRDSDAWMRSVAYTLHNPVKAGFCAGWRDWPYTVADPEAEVLVT